MIARWKARKNCHGHWWLCCQYTDDPTCNSLKDKHLIGRTVFKWAMWKEDDDA